MNLLLAAAAPLLVAGLLLLSGALPPAILAYHALCAVAVYRHRDRVETLLRRGEGQVRWTLLTTLLVLVSLALAPLLHDPAPYRELFQLTVLPWGSTGSGFALFAVYTLVVHAPFEEIFWRGVVLDPARPSVAGNAAFFYLLHALPMVIVLGAKGLLFALPAGAAGAIWAFVTIRTRSLWPGLVSHWGADAMILVGMWFYFIR